MSIPDPTRRKEVLYAKRRGRPTLILKRRVRSYEIFIATSRTPPWLPSGWGCRGRRLSRGRRNPGRQFSLWQCRRQGVGPAELKMGQCSRKKVQTIPRWSRTSGTQRLRRHHCVPADRLGRERRPDREFRVGTVAVRPIHRGGGFQKHQSLGSNFGVEFDRCLEVGSQ